MNRSNQKPYDLGRDLDQGFAMLGLKRTNANPILYSCAGCKIDAPKLNHESLCLSCELKAARQERQDLMDL